MFTVFLVTDDLRCDAVTARVDPLGVRWGWRRPDTETFTHTHRDMKIDSFEKLFVHELKDLYSAEKQLVRALPRMRDKATNDELKQAFDNHIKETEGQIQRLEQIFQNLEYAPTGEKCAAMEGLIEEAEDAIESVENDEVLNAALIAAAQRVEHYEIAGYGTARAYARRLGNKEAEKLLQETLDEEAKTDELLTQLAEQSVNQQAHQN